MSRFPAKAFLILLLLALVPVNANSLSRIERLTPEGLKAILDEPDVVVIDLRRAVDWKSSDLKIRGAVREDPMDVEAWAGQYPKDKRIVLYCD